MNQIIHALGFAALVILLICGGPIVAALILERRRRRAHAERRSPLGEDLLRSPGTSLRIQLDESGEEVTGVLLTLLTFPVSIIAGGLALSLIMGMPAATTAAPFYVVALIVMVALSIRKLLRVAARRDDLRKGYDAELAVGQELDQLMRLGAHVFHDVPAGRFNVDHVVIARTGIYAVETKGYSKPVRDGEPVNARVVYDGTTLRFPSWTTADPLKQAVRQSAWVASQLAPILDEPVNAVPVVALPGWYVERTGRGPVHVYSGKELKRLFSSQGDRALSPREIERAAVLLRKLCRTVKPLYSNT